MATPRKVMYAEDIAEVLNELSEERDAAALNIIRKQNREIEKTRTLAKTIDANCRRAESERDDLKLKLEQATPKTGGASDPAMKSFLREMNRRKMANFSKEEIADDPVINNLYAKYGVKQ